VSPEQLLGQLEAGQRAAVVADMEAGVGNLTRMQAGSVDVAVLVTEPSPRSIEVSRRARDIITERQIGSLLVTANKVRRPEDVERIRAALPGCEVVAVPDDPNILRADRDGLAPIDLVPTSPAVQAVRELALRLTAHVGR
jgi:CO dehydrogenase nickel-insertion accessory protein CooC1